MGWAGLYRVVARNPLGQTSCSVRVVLGDISGPPDSPSIEAMTDTDILLSWQTPAQLNHSAVICYKVQMGYIDTDIDWVDLADDIKHEYFVVDNLRPSHGYKFRVLAKDQFGWSIPSIPSGIVMTPSSGSSRAEFYDALQQIQAKEDIEDTSAALSYECEKKPMKIKSEGLGSLDFMSEIAKGRFAVTANVNKDGKVYSVKAFDKNASEGNEAAMREFKNLKTLRHEKMVSLMDAYETDKYASAVCSSPNHRRPGLHCREAFLHRADGVRDRLPGAGRAQLHPLARQGLPEPGARQHPGLLWSLPWQDCPSQACQL